MIDVSKYENASRNEITKAIDKCFTKLENLEKQKVEMKKAIKELQKFFNNSLKNIKKEEQKIIELDKAIEEYKNNDVERYANFEEYEKAMNAI